MSGWIQPDWPAPPQVHAFTTTRAGGVSRPPFDSLNLGLSVGDDPAAVAQNRALLRQALPSEPGWVRQVHGGRAVWRESLQADVEADAVVCATPDLACAMLTADCLPVLFCDRGGTRVAVAHAGWRGLAAGILEATVETMGIDPAMLLAWLGPGIGAAAYAVGTDLQARILSRYPAADAAFQSHGGRLHADLFAIARLALKSAGVLEVSGGNYCTFSDGDRFFSHRRDRRTGRMATAIWLAQ